MSDSSDEYGSYDYDFFDEIWDDFNSRNDFLCKIFARQLYQSEGFEFWDEEEMQLRYEQPALKYEVTISSESMRKELVKAFNYAIRITDTEIQEQYSFVSVVTEYYEGRELAVAHVHYMEDFKLLHKLLTPVIIRRGRGNARQELLAKIEELKQGEHPMELGNVYLGIYEFLRLVPLKAVTCITNFTKWTGLCEISMREPTMILHDNDFCPSELHKKDRKIIKLFDKLVEKIWRNKNYMAGDFFLDYLECVGKLEEIDTSVAGALLDFMREKMSELMEDKPFLAALVMDPRVNNNVSDFLTPPQKDKGINHLMCHWKYHSRFVERNLRSLQRYNSELDDFEPMSTDTTKLNLFKPPQKGAIRKKLRALGDQAPLGKKESVLTYWLDQEDEEPELAIIAGKAFAETAPAAQQRVSARLLESQKNTDEEQEKLIYILLTTRNEHIRWQEHGNWDN